MTRLTDAQYLELAVQCLEHARQSTAIRDCQCHACKGFMQQSGELIEDIKKRSAQETIPSPPPPPAKWRPIDTAPKFTDVLVWRADAGAFVAQFRGMDGLIDEDDEAFDADFEAWFANDTGWMEGPEKPTHWQPLPAGPSLTKESAR